MDIKNLLETLENKQKYDKQFESKLLFNKPDRLFISSENVEKTNTSANNSYYNSTTYNNFTVDLPRACIGVKTLQLVSATIPTTTGLSFNDNELIFYYYKIKTHRNYDDTLTIYEEAPNVENLYYVRLLPSYYKPELIPNNQLYGFNKTFNDYQELSNELAKACANDLAYTNRIGSVPFIPNDVSIVYNDAYNKFQMTGNNVNTPWAPPVWSSSVKYSINTVVEGKPGEFYISLIDNNLNNNPIDEPEAWVVYTYSLTNTYLIAGFNDPNVLLKAQQVNQVSDLFDFRFTTLYGVNNIVGITPQPFKDKKTLNLKLGFTWNGVYYWVQQVNILGYTNDNYEPQLYNRLRPVPQYEYINPLDELGIIPLPEIGNPYTANTFLFDGYCNLVVSSMLYLYTSIIGASTLDTFRNTNLLAIIPLNCTTLGVSFINTFIDNPLTKVNSDIQSIYFELRNEQGDLFNLGNNGICSFVLKLEY